MMFLTVLTCVCLCCWIPLSQADADPSSNADSLRNSGNFQKGFQSSLSNPRITEHPQDDYFAKNEPATLNCKAEGDPRPTITWYRNGKPVETNRENPISHRMLLDNGQLFFLRVIHSKNNHPDIGEYYCNATNSQGSVISRTANIQIAVLKDNFVEEPSDTTTAVGQRVVLQCSPPRGKPDPKVIWRKNGELVHTDDRIQIAEEGSLEIDSVEKKDIGEYMCLAINTGGERQSRPAQLRVLDVPVFHKLPKNVDVEEGQDVQFFCDVTGDPPIKVTWSKLNGVISFGRARVLPDHTLRIENVESDDDGVYICTAENAAGSTQATARLVVFSSPTFLVSPRDQVVARGRTVSLQCVAKGNPTPTVFWSKKSQENLMFANGESGHYSVAEDGTLLIEAVNETDAGVYVCEALNIRGAAYASAKVEVKEGAFILPDHDTRPPPVITIGPQNQTLHVDSTAVLQCEAEGKPTPIVRWYKNGRPLLMSGPRYIKTDSGTLQISDLKMQDTGSYTCKAVSETGETTWQAFLTVASNFGQDTVTATSPSLLPKPPTQPVVSDVTDTSVHLSWSPGTQTGQAQVLAFYVEYFGYDTTDGWLVASSDVKRESFTIDKLRPNTTYIFLVRAVNKYGVGYPSPVSESVRLLGYNPKRGQTELSEADMIKKLSGEIVEIDYTHSINSSAISLKWRVLQSADVIEGFQILYRQILDIRRLTYGEKKTIQVPVTVTTYMLTGLKSYSWYEIRVLAYSGKVQSQYSHPVKVQTAEKVYIPEPPQEVTVHKISDNRVSVQWKPPNTALKKMVVTGYKVFCVSTNQKDNRSVQTDGHTFNTVISGLAGSQEYSIKVAALTSQGVGKWSTAFIVDDRGVQPVNMDQDGTDVYSTPKSVTGEESGEEDLFKRSWFVGLLIAVGGVMLWLLLCIFSVWLCKRKKHRKKMKDQRFYTGVPLHKGEESSGNKMLYPPQYALRDERIHCNTNDLPPELRVLLPSRNKKEQDDDTIYKMAGDGSFPELKTFYQRADPVAPYATTALIQQQHLMKQRQQGMENMFRPINQGYIQHSEGSADSCQKPALSTDSNQDHSHNSHSTTDHNHSDHMSPTSDSGSHTTDENGLLLKQKKRSNSRKDNTTPKQTMNMNWPPPPEHPPPSECGEPPLYSEVRGDSRSNTHSPMSPVSFSQLSACSCPNPHTQTPVSGWNLPVYSDNDCPRCCSEKYYDPMTYCQEAYIRRTHSPRMQVLQHVNNRNIPTGHTCSPRATPSASIQYQYSKPHKGLPNCATPQGDKNKSNLKRASHSSHSDNEAVSIMPCLQSYKITPKSEKDYRFMHEEWGPDPAPPCHCEHDSGMGMEEDGINDRACQSSLPVIAPGDAVNNYNSRPNMSSSMQERYQRNCDSPASEEADYATESDLEQSQDQPTTFTGSGEHNTDCSSVQSSTCSSGDGTFLTEEDFASAVARAAEMSGLTVIGTTVCDPSNKSKKERRPRRQARPVSPGYSTDSNYGSIDMVRKPYPKSQRKQQLIEQGKGKTNFQSVNENNKPNNNGVYDTPYARTDYPMNITQPAFSLPPARFASLGRTPVYDSSSRMSPHNGSHSIDRGGYSSFPFPQNIVDMHLKEDIV